MLSSASCRSSGAGLVGRDHGSQHLLGAGLVLRGKELHGQHLVVARHRCQLRSRVGKSAGRIGARAAPVPAGEHARKPFDDGLVIGGDGLAAGIHLHAAIGVQSHQADGHQLHHFARVVLVRPQVGAGHCFLVAEHRQVHAHRRVQRHVFQQSSIVAQRIARQQVVEIGRGIGEVLQRADLRHHEDLRQRPGHALAQLVAALQGVVEPFLHARCVQLAEIEACGQRVRKGRFYIGQHGGGRLGQFRVYPARIGIRGIAHGDEPRGLRLGGAKGRLVQEAVGLVPGDLCGKWRRRWCRTGWRRRSAGAAATAGRQQCRRRYGQPARLFIPLPPHRPTHELPLTVTVTREGWRG